MIKLHNLTKLFGPQVAVHGIDLGVPAGSLQGATVRLECIEARVIKECLSAAGGGR